MCFIIVLKFGAHCSYVINKLVQIEDDVIVNTFVK